MKIDIEPIDQSLSKQIWLKIDTKTKPPGALGQLEKIAAKVALIQRTLSPVLSRPTIVVVAADHGVVSEGVAAFPQEVTFQMVMNFVSGGAAINVFARQHGIDLKIVDAGVNHDFLDTPGIIDLKIRKSTCNFVEEPAMSVTECEKAMSNGATLISNLHSLGCNVVGFGEMGIGNTTTAAALLAAYSDLPADAVVGRGTGVDESGLLRKQAAVASALEKHGRGMAAVEKLAVYGGFEIATIAGGMLQAASNRMLILVDGFIVTAALMAAHAINPAVLEYCLFCHTSNEHAHHTMLDKLGVTETVLNLDMRLGEGTGAAVAYPIVASSIAFFNEMASFQDTGISDGS